MLWQVIGSLHNNAVSNPFYLVAWLIYLALIFIVIVSYRPLLLRGRPNSFNSKKRGEPLNSLGQVNIERNKNNFLFSGLVSVEAHSKNSATNIQRDGTNKQY
jgi:hypothetical protein